MANDPLSKVIESLKGLPFPTGLTATPEAPVTLYQTAGGDHIVEDQTDPRGWRAANSQEIGNSVPRDVDYYAPGTTFGERFTVKNLSANLDAARAYLEGRGYEVRPFPTERGANYNLLVRKKEPGAVWRPVDPSASLNPVEFLRDITDWAGDIMVGTISGYAGAGASALGPEMIPVGLAAGAGLGEAARHGLGSLAGVPQNADPGQVETATAMGAVAPYVAGAGAAAGRFVGSRVLAPMGRGVQKLQREVSAALMSIPKSGTLDPDEILGFLSENKRRTLPTLRQAAEKVTEFFQALERKGPKAKWITYPEKAIATNMEADATQKGLTTDLTPFQNAVWNVLKDEDALRGDRNLGPQMVDVNQTVREWIASGGGDMSRVPVKIAVAIKRFLQKQTRIRGGYKGNPESPIGEDFRKFLSGASAETRIAVLKAMEQDYPGYEAAMAGVDYKEGLRRQFKTALHLNRKDIAGPGQVPYSVQQAVERYLNGSFGTSRGTGDQLIRDMEKTFGVALESEIMAARVGAIVGHEGMLPLRPRLTATGHFLNLGVALNTGLVAHSPGTGLLVWGGGLLAATPRFQLGATRMVNAAGRGLPKIGAGGLRLLTASAPAAGQGAARSVITDEDGRAKRAPLVVGGGY
jgi:hypothetical protein